MTGAEIACPASEEAGKRTTCSECKACGGTSAKARVSITIVAHGATARRRGGLRRPLDIRAQDVLTQFALVENGGQTAAVFRLGSRWGIAWARVWARP